MLAGLREPTDNTVSHIHSQQQEDSIPCRSHGQVQETVTRILLRANTLEKGLPDKLRGRREGTKELMNPSTLSPRTLISCGSSDWYNPPGTACEEAGEAGGALPGERSVLPGERSVRAQSRVNELEWRVVREFEKKKIANRLPSDLLNKQENYTDESLWGLDNYVILLLL